MFGLQDNQIKAINNVFAKYDNVEKVLVFGSRSKGTHKPSSDIDLTMLGKDLTSEDLTAVKQDLNALSLPFETDLSLFRNIDNELLKEKILNRNAVLYIKTK